MSTAVQIMQIIFYSIGILFMIAFMIIGTWSFVIFTKMFKNQRLQAFLLEKINSSISSIELSTSSTNEDNSNNSFNEDLLVEDSFFKDTDINTDIDNKENLYKIK